MINVIWLLLRCGVQPLIETKQQTDSDFTANLNAKNQGQLVEMNAQGHWLNKMEHSNIEIIEMIEDMDTAMEDQTAKSVFIEATKNQEKAIRNLALRNQVTTM